MIEGVRTPRDELVRQYGCSRRLATRLGALMSRHVTVSATVLEEARPGTILESLLLRKSLLASDDVEAALQALLAEDDFLALADEFSMLVVRNEEWQIIAAEEETLAEVGFDSVAQTAAEDDALPALLPTNGAGLGFDITRPAGHQASTASAFTPEEIARLRVKIFAGASTEEKVAALRQFAYAGVPHRDKVMVFLQAMANEEPALRAAAPQGLRLLGLSPAVSEAARLLAEGDLNEQRVATQRLTDLIAAGSDADRDAAVMALLGSVRDPRASGDLLRLVLTALEATAPQLGPSRLCREDVLRLLLERVLGAGPSVLLHLRAALSSIDAIQPGFVASEILGELSKTTSPEYCGALLEIITAMDLEGEAKQQVLEAGSATMLRLSTDSDACRMVGTYLTRIGDEGLMALAAVLPRADTSHQRHLVRLLDNALRSRLPSAEAREKLARAGLELLRKSPRQVRSDILETHLCAREDVSTELREKIAVAFLRDLQDYGRFPLKEIMEAALIRLGRPAVPPLLTALREHKGTEDAAILAAALGRIGMRLSGLDEPEALKLAEDILRELQKLTFTDTVNRDALHLAMGRICSQPGISPPVCQLIQRTLLGRLQGDASDAATLEALGLVCSGPAADTSGMRTVAHLVLNHLQATQPDPGLEVAQEQGEDVFRLTGPLDVYSALIPSCLAALGHITLGAGTPAGLRHELIRALLERWQKTITFEVQWGPGNVAQLTEILGRIGASDAITGDQRDAIANTLARHASEIPVLRALAAILARGDDLPQLDRLAGSLVLRLLQVLEEGEDLTPEDQEIYLHILAKVGTRGRFAIRGGQVDRLIERLADAVLRGLRQGIPGCTQHLSSLRDCERLPEKHRQRIDEELRRFTTLATRD